MRHLDTVSLTRESSDIVIGTVEATNARWSDDHRRIFTDIDVHVSRSIKGGGGDHLTLTQLGGELDGIKVSVPGGPLFQRGEEALVFVWRDPRGQAQVSGLAQGKFDIVRDARTGVASVQRTAPGFAIKDVRRLASAPAGNAAPGMPLDDMVREIQRAMAQGAGR